MARSAWTDFLQDFAFWLGDIAPVSLTATPIFTPWCAFSSISAPEIQLETKDIKEGNQPFVKKVLTSGGSLSSITLSRGARPWDADFYRWIMAAAHGTTSLTLGPESLISSGLSGLGTLLGAQAQAKIGGPTFRRTLMLVQFFGHLPVKPLMAGIAFGGLVGAGMVGANTNIGGLGSFGGAAVGAAAGGMLGGGLSALGADMAVRLPAKAWVLYGCIPKRYKASSDFDATSGSVSIQELEVDLEYVDELSLVG